MEIYDCWTGFSFPHRWTRHHNQLLLEESHSYRCNSLSHTPFLFLIHGLLPSPKLLIPALRSPSVIVLDNASYHNIKTEEIVVPNFNQRKAVLQDYLSKHNIPFQPLETKKKSHLSIKPSSQLPACNGQNHQEFSFFRSVGFRRTFTVYNSINRTVRYASSLACSFNHIIWIYKHRKNG
jgi:hypothetical protein